MRIALGIEYDGSSFHGFQFQGHDPCTIQAALERALSSVADQVVSIVPAGRTDAGVHATSQVVHFNTSVTRSISAWVKGGNTHLPPSIRILWAEEVGDDFHARFSATARTYRYICAYQAVRPCLLHQRVLWLTKPLDVELMQKASVSLLGEHDFSAFRAAGCQSKTPFRNLMFLNITEQDHFVFFDIKANAFLQNMVRNLVGSLVEVGLRRQPEEWMQTLLTQKDRRLAAATASPFGLYLCQVDYPLHFGLSQLKPRFPVFNFVCV